MKSKFITKMLVATAATILAITPLQAKAQSTTECDVETGVFVETVKDEIIADMEGEGTQKIDAPAKVWMSSDIAHWTFNLSVNGTGFYRCKLFKVGESNPAYESSWSTENGAIDGKYTLNIGADRTPNITSGQYYMEVYAESHMTEGWSDSDITKSEVVTYVRPSATLAVPSNIQLVGTKLMCNLPILPSGDYAGYSLVFEKYDETYDVYSQAGASWVRPDHNHHATATGVYTSNLEYSIKENGKYRFKIASVTDDMNVIVDSEYSDWYEVDFVKVAQEVEDRLTSVLNDSTKTADDIKNTLLGETDENKKLLMQSAAAEKNLTDAEDKYKSEKGITVSSEIADDVKDMFVGRPSIVGAAFNAGNDTKNMTLSIAKGTKETDYDKLRYQNAVQINMTLDGAANPGKLDMPVKVSIPIPSGVSATNLIILHYHNDGTMEEITPTIIGKNVEFVLTSFSDFVFANDTANGTYVNLEQIKSFVSRLYSTALGREAEVSGLNDWSSKLANKAQTGAEVAQGFFFSEEFTNKNLSDSDFVDVLYRTMFNREADADGKADWMKALDNGMSREFVYHGFAEGAEFKNLCDSFGIVQGTVKLTENRDQNRDLTAFVARNYTKALGRTAEKDGINDWTGRILKGEATPADVTAGFIFSDEFMNKNLDNEEFLKVLYQTYFDRDPDADGYNAWLEELNKGTTREYVVNTGFSCSAEFANLVAKFGL